MSRKKSTLNEQQSKGLGPGGIAVLILGTVVVTAMIVIGALDPGPAPAPAASPPPSVSTPGPAAPDSTDATLDRLQEDLDRRQAEFDSRVNAAPRTFVTDGTWEVGNEAGQMIPGSYSTSGGSCFWSRNLDATGELGSIIANGRADGPTVVEVRASDATFEASGGCTWSRRR